ncbi:ATP-binding protein [Aliigemmobacter aestuarii]|nr:ATP-binding protein [Gemmobacter aestuarii]
MNGIPQSSLAGTIARRIRLGVTVVLLVGFVVTTGALLWDVRTKLGGLRRASTDNAIWMVTQSEVEFLKLQNAMQMALTTLPERRAPLLAEVRRRFDVIYNRVTILEEGPIYAQVTQREENVARLEKLRRFLTEYTPLIDGEDAALAEAMPRFLNDSREAQDHLRILSIGTLTTLNNAAEAQRQSVFDTLMRLGLAMSGLVITLSVSLAMLRQQTLRTRSQAESIRLANARLDTVISTTGEGIIVTDRMGRIQDLNPAAEAMFGHAIAEVRGRDAVSFLCPPDVAETQRAAILKALPRLGGPDEPPIRLELETQRADGERFPIELSLAGTHDAENPRKGIVVGFLRDISERRRTERALARALEDAQAGERAKADFLAVMSHEMRTPLNGMVGAAELLANTRLTRDQRHLVEALESSGRLLLGHVNAVLDITAAQAGAITLHPVAVDVDRLLADCIANQEPAAQANGNTLSLRNLTGPLGRAETDPARLGQIMLNLINNAVKFTRNGSVTVETEYQEDAAGRLLEIRVVDTGPGIPHDEQAHIFDEFVTLETGYARQEGGTGLGLAVARRLAEALGGEIGLESEPGMGSVFWVRIPMPLARAADSAASADERTGAPPSGRRILVIEDNSINRFILRKHLVAAGHQVVEAADGVEGVALAGATPFDVILTDISMPRLNGVDTTRQIRAGAQGGASKGARIIAVTAHALPDELASFRAAGIDDVLIKPISNAALQGAIDGTMDARAADRRPPAATQAPLIDEVRLHELCNELGPGRIAGLLDRVLGEGDATIARIADIAALPDPPENWDEAQRLCHTLAGTAGTFGAARLADALRQAEIAIKTGHADRLTLAGLAPVWSDTRAALVADRSGEVIALSPD